MAEGNNALYIGQGRVFKRDHTTVMTGCGDADDLQFEVLWHVGFEDPRFPWSSLVNGVQGQRRRIG